MHGPALIGSALFLYQFLAHRCAILYTRLFSLFLSRRILFFHPEESERLQGRPAYAAASPGAKLAKNRRCFALSSGAILYTGSFFSGRTPPPALAAAFWDRSEGGLFAESAVLPFFSACKCLPEALPPLDSPPELRPPPLYTARPICWLTFPLGSDTISIKHRKGRPAPWPSS